VLPPVIPMSVATSGFLMRIYRAEHFSDCFYNAIFIKSE